MGDVHEITDKFETLRQKARELVQNAAAVDAEAPLNMLELIQELRIHQIELEIQNEELRRIQQELFELNSEHETLYEFAPCGYITLNRRGMITRVNLTGVKLLGEPRQMLTHVALREFVAERWQSFYLEALKKAGETGRKQTIELPLKCKDVPPCWVRLDVEADRDPSGRVVRWRLVLLDASKQKKAEEALLQSEDHFRQLFSRVPVAYQSLDAEGNFIAVNDTWLSTLGYGKEEVLGKNFVDFLDPNEKKRFRKNFARFKSVDVLSGIEYTLRKKDGTDLIASFQGNIGTDSRGEFKQTHSVFQDITGRQAAEEEKKRLEERLAQAEKMESIGTLAGGIAHEFNNILAIILGNTELIAEDIPKWLSISESIEEIRTASLRAKEVVRQLLTFSRGNGVVDEPLLIGDVLQESVKLIRSSTPANIEIKLNISDDISPVFGNATQINQLLINLCRNAIDAMSDAQGLITIELCNETIEEGCANPYASLAPGRYVKIVVADNGVGMDKATLARVFEPYFTTKPFGVGSGIGLAVVHGIVKRHKGIITVASKPGQGTVFTIFLPIFEDKIEKKPQNSIELPTGVERILLVDDEPTILNLVKLQLQRLGYHVTQTTRPLKAFEWFKAHPTAFDLVITDMAMPGMTGERLAVEILKIDPAMPIILCTGYSERLSEKAAAALGVRALVIKPVTRAELAETVRTVLHHEGEK